MRIFGRVGSRPRSAWALGPAMVAAASLAEIVVAQNRNEPNKDNKNESEAASSSDNTTPEPAPTPTETGTQSEQKTEASSTTENKPDETATPTTKEEQKPPETTVEPETTADSTTTEEPATTEPPTPTPPTTMSTTSTTDEEPYSLENLPTLAGATIPTMVVPDTSMAPYRQNSKMPENTFFIITGSILGAFFLLFLLWPLLATLRGLCCGGRRSRPRNMETSTYAPLKETKPPGSSSGYPSSSPVHFAATRSGLLTGNESVASLTGVHKPNGPKFFSPTAGPAGARGSYNRPGSFLPGPSRPYAASNLSLSAAGDGSNSITPQLARDSRDSSVPLVGSQGESSRHIAQAGDYPAR